MDRSENGSGVFMGWTGGGGSWEPDPPPPPQPPPPPPDRDDDKKKKPADPKKAFGPEERPGRRSGLVLGRFLPPHRGHQHLIDFARACSGHLTVLLFSRPSDPVPGALRAEWLRETFPGVNVLHAAGEPAPPGRGSDEPRRWVEIVRQYVPEGPSYVFASDDHGLAPFARYLGAEHVPVDPGRVAVPVSASMLREDVLGHWGFLVPAARAHFVRRVCLLGPESSGKSTLARELAARLGTVFVPEYARALSAQRGGLGAADFQQVARGQLASEDALARQASRVLVCDTDLLSVKLWSERLFGASPDWVSAAAASRRFDLYLVTAPDVPFVGPASRDEPAARRVFHARCLEAVGESGQPLVSLAGSWEQRRARAFEAVDKLLASKQLLPARSLALPPG